MINRRWYSSISMWSLILALAVQAELMAEMTRSRRAMRSLGADFIHLPGIRPTTTSSCFNVSRCAFDARDNVEKALSRRASELQEQLSRLGRAPGFRNLGRGSSLKGRKVAIKYRDRSGNTWAGRGAHPVWLREKVKAGAKLENIAIHTTVATHKASPTKTDKPRKAKR